jgi:WD40 repeat protein
MNPGAEKSKRRVATAARRETLKRLQENGTLLANELAPRMTGARTGGCLETWALKPAGDGVVLLWAGERSQRWRQFAPPAWEPREVPFPAGLDALSVQFSSSGRWLAACEGWRERRLRIWNWETGRQVAEHQLDHPGPTMSFSADENRLYVTASLGLILSLPTTAEAGAIQEIRFESADSFRGLAPHPGGGWLAVECRGRLGMLELGPPARLREMSIGGQWDPGATMLRELNKPEFQRKFAELKERAPAQQTYLDELLRLEKQISGKARAVPLERLLALCFTPDGHWLVCGTSEGVRVFDWAKLIEPEAKAVEWDYAVAAEEPDPELDKYASRAIHCVGFDSLRQRVLFSGEEGKLKYLELGTGRTGELLGAPERTPITRFALSDDRGIIAITRVEGGHGNERRARFQIWSYPALCAAVGLEF